MEEEGLQKMARSEQAQKKELSQKVQQREQVQKEQVQQREQVQKGQVQQREQVQKEQVQQREQAQKWQFPPPVKLAERQQRGVGSPQRAPEHPGWLGRLIRAGPSPMGNLLKSVCCWVRTGKVIHARAPPPGLSPLPHIYRLSPIHSQKMECCRPRFFPWGKSPRFTKQST